MASKITVQLSIWRFPTSAGSFSADPTASRSKPVQSAWMILLGLNVQLRQGVYGSNDCSFLCAHTPTNNALRAALQIWCGECRLSAVSAGRQTLLSVLKGDDRVHFVDVVRAVPEHPREVVGVRRVVQLYLLAESAVLWERVNLSFVINNLRWKAGWRKKERKKKNSITSTYLLSATQHFARVKPVKFLPVILPVWHDKHIQMRSCSRQLKTTCPNSHVHWRCRAGLWSDNPYQDEARYKWTPRWSHSLSSETSESYRCPLQISFRTPDTSAGRDRDIWKEIIDLELFETSSWSPFRRLTHIFSPLQQVDVWVKR